MQNYIYLYRLPVSSHGSRLCTSCKQSSFLSPVPALSPGVCGLFRYFNGSGWGGSGQGTFQLFNMSRRPEKPRDHPLRTQLLFGLYRELLGPGRLPGSLRLPSVPTEFYSEAAARQKHNVGRRGGEI